MAYVAGEFQYTVRGFLQDGAELFNNTWTCLTTGGSNLQDPADRLHTFYESVALLELSSHTTVTACEVRDLASNTSADMDWDVITGNDLADPMPGQLAVRVSLAGPPGVNGGPFIAGWSKNAGDEFGNFGHAASMAESLTTLCQGLILDDWQLRIDRPSVPGTVAVLSARVGQRFDVIRKRGNAIGEQYVAAAVT